MFWCQVRNLSICYWVFNRHYHQKEITKLIDWIYFYIYIYILYFIMHISILCISSHGLSDAVKYPLNIAHQTKPSPFNQSKHRMLQVKLWRMPRLDILQHVFWGCPTTAMWNYRLGPEKAKRMLLTGVTWFWAIHIYVIHVLFIYIYYVYIVACSIFIAIIQWKCRCESAITNQIVSVIWFPDICNACKLKVLYAVVTISNCGFPSAVPTKPKIPVTFVWHLFGTCCKDENIPCETV